MTLTVIIPAYNRERFIEGCIRSLVAGGVEDTEMLVVDDGSSDNTASIVENLCAEMPFLRLIRQENRGPGGARNTGMTEATGDWIWFIDSDDHVVPGAIPYIISSIKAYPGVDSDAVAPEDRPWLNGRLSRWTVGTLKTYRGKDGYSDIIRPILPVIRKEYNRRSGTLPFHIRFRDNLRMLRALIRR